MKFNVVDTRSGKILNRKPMFSSEAFTYLERKRDRVSIADRPSFMLRLAK